MLVPGRGKRLLSLIKTEFLLKISIELCGIQLEELLLQS